MTEKPKKPIFKKWWFWVICVVVVIGIVGAIASGGKEPNVDTNSNPSSQIASITSDSANKDTEEFDWVTSEVTKETVEQALEKKRIEKVHIEPSDTPQKNIQITVDISSHSGDLAMRGLFKYLNEYSAILFENPNVTQVMVRGQIKLMDDKGNESSNDATNVVWTRETAESINHDNYNDIAMGSQYPTCFETADEYFIHQTIFKKMSEAGNAPASKSAE